MRFLFALAPLVVVLGLMVIGRWSGQRAGPVGWGVGALVGWLAFGLTPQVLWISQLKGLQLSMVVLAVLWPALGLYHLVSSIGGIQAITHGLSRAVGDVGLLWIVLAWAFSGALEGVAGFGVPLAVVAPMLVELGVEPIRAVAAVAVGHAWSVTFGDMGVIFQTLVAVSNVEGVQLAPVAAVMLGLACLLCGWAVAHILGQRRWGTVALLAAVMGVTQYALAVSALAPLAALGAGLAGVGGSLLLARRTAGTPTQSLPGLGPSLFPYLLLAALMMVVTLVPPIRAALYPVVWQASFPQVETLTGFVTPAGQGQAFRPFMHPGVSLVITMGLSYALYRRLHYCEAGSWHKVATAMWRSAAPASVGIISMVGLATLMEHCGMTLLLAQGLSAALGSSFPLAAPLVGILGAFATGSNNNSNVLFAPLQKSVALLLSIDPRVLLAAQTAGGSLGSMVAPAKIIVGCSTVGAHGRDGEVLRRTAPYGLAIGLLLGALAWIWVSDLNKR